MRENELVGQHPLIYETAPRVWQDGFPIGNGHLGALVYQPEAKGIDVTITKLDVWDRRAHCFEKVPFERIRELAETDPGRLADELRAEAQFRENHTLPGPKPCGTLRLGIDDWSLSPLSGVFHQDQRLSLEQATVSGDMELSAKASRFEAFVCPDRNVLAIRRYDTWRDERLSMAYRQNVRLARDADPDLGVPEFGTCGAIMWLRYRFPDGFTYAVAVVVDGTATAAPAVGPDAVSVDAILDYGSGSVADVAIFVAAATSKDGDDPLEQACNEVRRARDEGWQQLHEGHCAWWRRFWSRSAVQMENRFLEAIYSFSMYEFASSSRGNTCPGLFGLWNGSNNPPWSGDYHADINLPMTYWHVFSSNRIDLAQPFLETFTRIAPVAREQTRQWYGIDGLRFPLATLDTGEELTPSHYRMMQCSTGFYGLLFWKWYVYTHDTSLLEDPIFPILEDGVKFYLALAADTDDGLRFGPSWAPEQGPLPAYNVNNDLGLIKPLMQAYLEACDVLGVDGEVRSQVEECLQHFPDYPQLDGEFLDSQTAGEFIGLNHPGLLAMVVPGEDVDADSELARVARTTLHHYLARTNRRSFTDREGSACDLTWPWLLCVALKLRDTEFAERMLLSIGLRDFLKPNGFFAFIGGGRFGSIEKKRAAYGAEPHRATHALFAQSSCMMGRRYTMSMLQQNAAFIFAVNEMMLQSQHGVIRLFPAVPACVGDCAFRDLRAEGAFRVSARRRNGRLENLVITSETGGDCTLCWDQEETCAPEFVRQNDEQRVRATPAGKQRWRIPTQPGMTYAWPASSPEFDLALTPAQHAGIRTMTVEGEMLSYGLAGRLHETGR